MVSDSKAYKPGGGLTPAEQSIEAGALLATSKAINTDYFAANISPTNPPCVHTLQILMATTTIVKLEWDDGATTDLEHDLNSGGNLNAGNIYSFSFLVPDGCSYNIQHETGTQNVTCYIIEHQDYGGT